MGKLTYKWLFFWGSGCYDSRFLKVLEDDFISSKINRWLSLTECVCSRNLMNYSHFCINVIWLIRFKKNGRIRNFTYLSDISSSCRFQRRSQGWPCRLFASLRLCRVLPFLYSIFDKDFLKIIKDIRCMINIWLYYIYFQCINNE
jgi:hypothetical protein